VTHDQVEAMGLGDRIAVMSEGRIRQLGTPHDVYHDPADTFVATFLGSPPMNIVSRDDVLLGFRPEALLPKGVVQPDDDAVTVPFSVHRVENLGSERHLVGTVSGIGEETRVIAMLPSTVSVDVPVDETTEFVIRGADLRFFDKSTGLRTERVRL
jgi:multiple sugar transport system ATP-binding protein